MATAPTDPTTNTSGVPSVNFGVGGTSSSMPASVTAGTTTSTGTATPTATSPATEPALLSSEQGVDHLQQQTDKLNTVMPPTAITTPQTTPANGGTPAVSTSATPTSSAQPNTSTSTQNTGSATFLNPDTGESKVVSGDQLTPSMVNDLKTSGFYSTDSSGTLPPWFVTGNVAQAQAAASTAKAKSDLDDLRGQLAGFKTSDADLNETIVNINAQWDVRAQQLEKANAAEVGNLNTVGIRLGAQYTGGSFGSIIASAEREGVQRLSDLDVSRQTAILAAKKAAQDQNWQVFSKQVDLATQAYSDQQKTLADLNKSVADQNQKLQDKVTQANTDSAIADLMKKGVTDPTEIAKNLKDQGIVAAADTIATSLKNLQPTDATAIGSVALEAAKNGAPQSVITAINGAKSANDAIASAGGYLQQGTGDVANYLQYKRDAMANGQTPEDFTTWKAADTKTQNQAEYGKAFATAAGTAAGKASVDNSGPVSTSPVTSSTGATNGLTFNAPASIAPYVNFSYNGVKYVDLSAFKGTPTEANQAVQDAQNAGYKVITNKNSALDVQNITDALTKLDTIKTAFEGINPDNAAERDSYGIAFITMAKKLQTDPNAAASGVFQDAALDILKAMSGTQGFRGGASMVEAVQSTFPSNTDTKAVSDQKIANMVKLITDRQNALVGKPSSADQLLIDGQKSQGTINDYVTKNPDQLEFVKTLYGVAGATDASVLAYMKLHPETYNLSQ